MKRDNGSKTEKHWFSISRENENRIGEVIIIQEIACRRISFSML